MGEIYKHSFALISAKVPNFIVYYEIVYLFGGVLLCGFTGTIFGPGLGALGFFLGVGDGVDLLCGFTGTVLFAMIIWVGFNSQLIYIYCTY